MAGGGDIASLRLTAGSDTAGMQPGSCVSPLLGLPQGPLVMVVQHLARQQRPSLRLNEAASCRYGPFQHLE
jgi:hypothetical protein